MFRSIVERSTISPTRVSFAISRLAAPKNFQRSYLLHNNIIISPSSIIVIQQHRNYSFVQNLKKIFKGEIDKNKDLKESLDELKKVKDTVKDTKVAQDVIQTASVGLTKGKGILDKTKTYLNDLNIGSKLKEGFEKTSDKVTDAVSNIPKKYTKLYPGSEEEKADEERKKTEAAGKDNEKEAGPVPTNDPMASTATTAESIRTDQTTEAVKPEGEPVQATQETAQETAQGTDTDKETEKENKVYDLVPVAEKKKNWFSISHTSSLAKTVERIRIYHPNFSIVDFMSKINPIHHDFLVALYTQDIPALSELAVPEFVEKIQAAVVPLKPGEPSNKCHVLELYDSELDSTDPERVAIKVTFEAQIVLTTHDGQVIQMAYDRSDKTTQVTQLRGAFEWIFEENNITINDFAVYTTEVIY